MRQHSIDGMGGRPRWRSVAPRVLPGREIAPPGTSRKARLPGPVRSQGRAARCVIQNWPHVLSASRRAWICMGTMARAAWTRGRARAAGRKLRRLLAQRALGRAPGRHRDRRRRAEYLAEFLDRDECAQRGQQVLPQQAQLPQAPIQQVPLQSGRLQSGPLQQVKLTESAPEGTGEYPSSALLGAPVPSAAAASQRIRPGIWPAGPRVSFPAR